MENKNETSGIDLSSPEFKNALNVISFTRNSLFLTGKAGTGKSTFLRYLCKTTKKKHVVLAPTGIAAINAGGMTIHSFFKLPFFPLVPDDSRFSSVTKLRSFLKYNKDHCKLIKSLELIVIDEISMVRADVIDFIDRVLRVYSGNQRDPFGGKQMLFVGDLFQLEPVVTRDERDILHRFWDTPFFFSARVFSQMPLVSIELTKVYRQTDRAFITVLDHIRTNTVTPTDLQLLNIRAQEGDDANRSDDDVPDGTVSLAITLAPRKETVDSINSHRLAELPGEMMTFEGEIKGDFPAANLPTPMSLDLKVGAQVIFVKNDKDKRWVNGTLGIISGIDVEGNYLYITTDEGMEYDVAREQWENVRYTYNEKEKKIEEEQLGVYIQFPVRLAWAITIHKSQGLTFDNVVIDLTGGVFTGGQTYVALSRCRSLEGLTLRRRIGLSDVIVNREVINFSRHFNDDKALKQALDSAVADIEYADAVSSFDNRDFDAFFTHFFKAIHARYDIEKPLAKRYMRRKLSVISGKDRQIDELKFKIGQLEKTLDTKQKQLDKYAVEYLRMGDECMEANAPKAALANYDKALNLNPVYVEAYVAKGKTLLAIRDFHGSLSALNKALTLAPINTDALLARAHANMEAGYVDAAFNDANRLLSFDKKSIDGHELMADILDFQDKEEEAELHREIARQLRKKKKRK